MRSFFPLRLARAATVLVAASVAPAVLAAQGAVATPQPKLPMRAEIEEIVKEAHDAARDAAREVKEHAGEQARHLAEMARMYAEAIDLDDFTFEPSSLAYVQSEFGNVREIVKNAPYTAEAVNESIQVLQDGNRIVKRTTTLLARDTYGRTRQERKGPKGSSVYIFDPIDGKSYALNTERKVAVRIPRVPQPPVPSGHGTFEYNFSAPATPPPPPPPPAPPLPPSAAPTAVDVQPGPVIVRKGREGEDVRVEVVRVDRGDAMAFAPPTPLALPLLPRGNGDTRSLGTREFEGVKADGTQTSYTIPAGEIGNEKPIVVTSERWFSPEFNIVVYAKQSDPRTGDTIYRLTNFKRGEPAADLFKVPAEYKSKGDRRR